MKYTADSPTAMGYSPHPSTLPLLSDTAMSQNTQGGPVPVTAAPPPSTQPDAQDPAVAALVASFNAVSISATPDARDPRIIALEARFKEASDLEVWEHCVGGRLVKNIPEIAKDLANHIIVICIDCEHWSNNTDETTEVGIATFGRQDVLPIVATKDFGDHGENLMKEVRFYLLRTIETSHLPNQNPASRGVEGNRFGRGRFVTFAEARQILTDLFVQPISDVPRLKGYFPDLKGNFPIVVLGHDVGHDLNNLKSKAIAFDMEPIGTVVRYIDTQLLVRDKGYWMMPRNEQVGLRRMVEELSFEHRDSHTAANDAARTLISAFQIVLGGHKCKKFAHKSMEQVAEDLERHSVANFDDSLGGVEKYCFKCGTIGHMKPDCTATDLHCDECEENNCDIEPGKEHVTEHCICVANKKALIRREKDAIARALKKPKTKNPHRGGLYSNWGRPMSRRGTTRPSGSTMNYDSLRQYFDSPGGHGFAPPGPGGHPSVRGFGGHLGQGGYGNVSFGRGRGGYPPRGGQGGYNQG
ncbi:hypothetical protein J4E89_001378 [Alternaria sp. Ai002NY15]|nr:hypothetical protein J4E89_001378 [Alternaria sp. Ai002NY15]